jgi:exportin-T
MALKYKVLSLSTKPDVLKYCRSLEDSRQSMALKDAMRESCIADVAEAWYQLAVAYQETDPQLAASVLSTMGQYVNWIDISLIANKK